MTYYRYRSVITGIITLILLLRLPGGVIAGETDSEDIPFDIGYNIAITVALVQVTATVVDHRGLTVLGLEKEDFYVLEDGEKQEIVEFSNARGLTKRILILFDVSGSMRIMNKIGAAKEAVSTLINRLKPEDEISLLFFADGAVEVACDYTTDRELVLSKIKDVAAYGQTALRDAVKASPGFAKMDDRFQRAMLLITDGIDNASKVTMEDAINTARQVDLPIYTIGVDPIAGRNVGLEKERLDAVAAMRVLSEESGGRFFQVGRISEFFAACDQLVRDLENQYLLVFISQAGGVPGNHKIEVKTKKWRSKVRARQGYYVAK